MGTFSVPIETGRPAGKRYEPVDALVDTGASYTLLSASLLRQLGVPAHDRVPLILAGGCRILRDVGRTWIRVGEKSEVRLVVFGNGDAEALLGAYALQGLPLAVWIRRTNNLHPCRAC